MTRLDREPPVPMHERQPGGEAGLIMLRIGAGMMIRPPGRRAEQHNVEPLENYPDEPKTAFCGTCCKTWQSEAAIRAAHSHEVLAQTGSQHLWAWLARPAQEPQVPIPPDATSTDRLRIEMENMRRANRRFVLLSSAKWATVPGPNTSTAAPMNEIPFDPGSEETLG